MNTKRGERYIFPILRNRNSFPHDVSSEVASVFSTVQKMVLGPFQVSAVRGEPSSTVDSPHVDHHSCEGRT